MPTETSFEELSDADAVARLDAAMARAQAGHAKGPTKTRRDGRKLTPRTKRRLSDVMFARRKAEALLAGPTRVASLRLARELTQRDAAERATIATRTWCRAEADIAGVGPATQRRVARALGVDVSELRD